MGRGKEGLCLQLVLSLRSAHLFFVFFSFLGYVDLLGTTYSASTLATGYGSYIAQPLLRKYVEGREDTLTEEEATEILETCMKVLFYRDARSLNKVYHIYPYSSIHHQLSYAYVSVI
jgi:20S proteasome alpha/beta subunit